MVSLSPPARRRVRIGLGLVAGVTALCVGAVVACEAILPSQLDLFGPPRSGPEWCREQAQNRPFLKMVDRAAIGGPAWPEREAITFWFSFSGPPRLGTRTADFRTVRDAVEPGTLQSGANRRIEPLRVQAAQAAAARLDLYCAAHDR